MKTALWLFVLIFAACLWYLFTLPRWEFQGNAIIVAGNCADCYQDPSLIRFLNTTDIPVVRFNNNRRFFRAKHTISVTNDATAYRDGQPDVIAFYRKQLGIVTHKVFESRAGGTPSLVFRERNNDTTGWAIVRHLLKRKPSPPTIYVVGFSPLSNSTTGLKSVQKHSFKNECMKLQELVDKRLVIPLHADLSCGTENMTLLSRTRLDKLS